MQNRLWELNEFGFRSDALLHFETLFTIGNGYVSTRGAFEEGYEGDTPTTLVHGIYNHAPEAPVPELVNLPNWLPIRITIDGTAFQLVTKTDDILRPPQGYVLGYQRSLNLYRGLLRREVLFRAASGSVVRLTFERFASLSDQHVLAQRVLIVAVDGSPTIRLESILDGSVTNGRFRHWLPDMRAIGDGSLIGLAATTGQSGYRIGAASKLISSNDLESHAENEQARTVVSEFTLKRGEVQTFDKISAVYTSRDIAQPFEAAQRKVDEAARAGYGTLLQAHEAEWASYWKTSDIRLDGDDECQLALRFTKYHVLIAAPRSDEHVSIGAKTLSGLGYKGHIFWDTELFIVPTLILSHPDLARNLLMYRYHNLSGAHNKAAANGYEGAMYPWESTDTGEETTPEWSDVQADGTRIRIWTGDSEQHISTDIAYAVWHYWSWTGDDAFLKDYGAEVILDTAKFWGSRVEEKNGWYEISRQIGPDEYHENIDNSVFVNRMVVWHLQTALDVLDWLRRESPVDAERLTKALDLSSQRVAYWRDVMTRMFIPFDSQRNIHIQFPGFFDMEYIPVPDYVPRVTSVQAILGHPRTVQSQVIKQADVVMLMALLGERIGAPDGADVRQVMLNNWNTYFPRTDHGSSLSPAVHARVAARLGLKDIAYEMFHHAAHIDLYDNKGNVRDGIHAAACGGVWQAVVFGFCGLHIDAAGEPALDPHLPDHWREVTFSVYYRGKRRTFTVENPALVSSTSG